MISALSALDNLPSSSSSSSGTDTTNNSSEATTIDARSVRAAIEQDALHQALLFEDELRKLVAVVSGLRSSVCEIGAAAAKVKDAIDTDVICLDLEEVEGGGGGEGIVGGDGERLDDAEKTLARVLADAFRAKDEAQRRADTVRTFLEKFDSSENDNYLLDHYSFEEFAPGYNNSGDKTGGGGGGSNAGGGGGVAAANANTGSQFLNALRRVCQIRVELAKTFGGFGCHFRESNDGESGEQAGAGVGAIVSLVAAVSQFEHCRCGARADVVGDAATGSSLGLRRRCWWTKTRWTRGCRMFDGLSSK